MSLLAPVAYNEGGLILFGTLAAGWMLLSMRDDARPIAAIVAGGFAGFACGVKLTAVPVIVLAVPVAVLAAKWSMRNLRQAILFVVVAGAVFSPWLVRNVAWAGNPVFPEGMSLFGRAHFSETQQERWTRDHAPTAEQRPVPARLAAFNSQIVADKGYAWILLPMAVLAAVIGWRRVEIRVLVILIVLHALFWIGLTHLQGRFFVLFIPWGAIAIAIAFSKPGAWRVGVVVASLVMAGIGLQVITSKIAASQIRFSFFGETDLRPRSRHWQTTSPARMTPSC